MIPAGLQADANSTPGEFHLEPHYRERTALDAALPQIRPGSDGFLSEQFQSEVAGILDEWSTDLLRSPQSTQALERALSEKFRGTSWKPVQSSSLHTSSPSLDVERVRYPSEPSLIAEEFMAELRVALRSFSTLVTAEFQITAVDPGTTRVRYELAGSGHGFYREHRSGEWLLQWEAHRLVRWEARDEVRCRAARPFFADVTRRAFERNGCYASQMLHGADYWRGALDGASGIDIYGHNGVSAGDIYGNGWDDLYVCQPAGLPNRLFRNRGDGTFDDITEASGVGLLDNTACALFADFDNDGRQDLVVVRANGPLLFLNEGNGKFRLKPDAFRFANAPQGTFTGAAAADYNHDGWLDIYFCLYTFYQGADQYRYPTPYFAAENGPPNFLMHNNGDGTFRDVTAASGLDKNNTRFSFCCGWGDANGDGWPDLYVVNDFGRKNLYRNKGDGTFEDVAGEAGVEDVGAGMSVCWLDYDNDGTQDLYVANMWTAAGERITGDAQFQRETPKEIQALYRKHSMGNSLLRNTGSSRFRDETAKSGTGLGRWAWSSDAWDFDHDGCADIYVANGMISGSVREDLNSFFWRQVVAKSPQTARAAAEYEQGWSAINEFIRSGYSWSGYERNVLYANHGDRTFSDISGAVGMDFREDSRAFALADFDRDGRQEMLLKNRNAPQLRLMKSVISDLPPAISFCLRGTKSNRDGIGAAVTVVTSAGRQSRMLQAGSGFLSQHSKELFFGLGTAASGKVSASIRWPSGSMQEWKELPAGHRIYVTEEVEAVRVEAFRAHLAEEDGPGPDAEEVLPAKTETWLLVPVVAPESSWWERGRTTLLCFSAGDVDGGFEGVRDLRVAVVNVKERANEDVTAVYNLLFRYLFDSHRDLPLPCSFLIDEQGRVVKVYQGGVDASVVVKDLRRIPRTSEDRLARALPFGGVSNTYEFGRNYLSLGSVFFQRGYMEAAGGFFRSALKEDASSAEAYYGVGSVLLRQDRNGEARDCFEHAVKLKASYPETAPNAWNNLGLLATREGDTARGVNCFEQALRVDPDHFITLVNLGNTYRKEKRWEEARKTLERAVAMKPEDAEGNYGLAMVYAQEDDSARAYEFLQKALQARPEYPEALNNLGVLYLRTRRRDDAVEAFAKCIRVAPQFDQSYINLARVYAIEGDRAKAREVLQALLARHPEHVQAREALEQLQ